MALLVGVRSLDGGDWGPVDDQFMMGFDIAYEPPDSVFGVEVGLTASYDDREEPGRNPESGVGEVHVGLRRTFARRSRLQPYVGIGVSAVSLHVDGPGVADDDDQTFAGYARGGLVLFLGETFFVGIDANRLFGTDIDLDGVPGDIDSTLFALVLGGAL